MSASVTAIRNEAVANNQVYNRDDHCPNEDPSQDLDDLEINSEINDVVKAANDLRVTKTILNGK